jgi:hypothetical protein
MARIFISRGISLAMAATSLSLVAPAAAQSSDTPSTLPVIDQLYACRAIADPAQRLACYDSAVAAVQTAVQSRDIRIIDRDTAARADVALARPVPIQSVDSTIRTAARDVAGRLTLLLENGQVWVQTEGDSNSVPRAGTRVQIRRTTLGGYFATVGNRPGFRVRQNR